MSKLIKSGNVILDKPKDLLSTPCPTAVDRNIGVKEPENESDNDNVEDSRADLIHLMKFRAEEVYEQSRKQGGIAGYAEGLRHARLEGERQKEEALCRAAESVEKLKSETELEYQQTVRKVNQETFDFAVAIASRVLNNPLEGKNLRYSELISQTTVNVQPDQIILDGHSIDDSEQSGQPGIQVAIQTHAEDPITLEEILQLAESGRTKLLENIDMRDIAVSLKLADESVTQTILDHFSDRIQDAIREEISLSGPLIAEDAVKARIRIGKVFRRLRADGEI